MKVLLYGETKALLNLSSSYHTGKAAQLLYILMKGHAQY